MHWCYTLRMPTKNPRINITLSEETAAMLSQLAKQEHVSTANLARELILEAMKRREDKLLSLIAARREFAKAKRIKHEDVWK